MTQPLDVPPSQMRAAWVFAIDLPSDESAAFINQAVDEPAPCALASALGVSALDHDFVEMFDVEKIRPYGFARYLIDANNMDEESVAPDAALLDAMTGAVAVIFSEALPDGTSVLRPAAPLRLIGRYVDRPDLSLKPALQSDAAHRTPLPEQTRPTPSDAAMQGRIAAYVLIGLFAFVALMIWISAQ